MQLINTKQMNNKITNKFNPRKSIFRYVAPRVFLDDVPFLAFFLNMVTIFLIFKLMS